MTTTVHSTAIDPACERDIAAAAWGSDGADRIALWLGIHAASLVGAHVALELRTLYDGQPFYAPSDPELLHCAAESGMRVALPPVLTGLWVTLRALDWDARVFGEPAIIDAHARLRESAAGFAAQHCRNHASAFAALCSDTEASE
ncbi:MAG TPA: hypothetical protein VFN67_33775 [Polyangiales bacterium]|nr:hypothetical protein [Polyangiales bacterium]